MGLLETKPCEIQPCVRSVNCTWGDWHEWSGCTCSCGGGQHVRNRNINQSPRGYGKLCDPHQRSQVGPCNTQSCRTTKCVDGIWDKWSNWGNCTAKCGGGIRWRARKHLVQANFCGKAAKGEDSEYRVCNSESCSADIDCE